MDFTPDQYDFLKRFENGLTVTHFTDDEKLRLSYFEKKGLIRPRVDIRENWWVLTDDGQRVLYQHQKAVSAAKIRTQEKIDALLKEESLRQENIQKEKDQEDKLSKQIAAEKDERRAEKRADRIFQISLTIFDHSLSLITGLILEHYLGIIDFLLACISNILEIFKSNF